MLTTEQVLAAGFHQRLHDAFPGIEEVRLDRSSSAPVLVVPERPSGEPQARWFVARDREEELADFARAVKRTGVSERTALVFQRPLPYIYLARSVFTDAHIPYQALDARPLAAEPFAAALDLVFEVAMSEATRGALVDLLGSPHWTFAVDASNEAVVDHSGVAALDAWLHEIKYLGGWERLEALAAAPVPDEPRRANRLQQKALRTLQAAAAAARDLRRAIEGPTASAQFRQLVGFVNRHERLPQSDDPALGDHMRARGAILGALTALADAQAAHDDEPLLVTELANTIRRWIERQTFAPRTGTDGLTLLDARAAAYSDVDDVRLIGLVESDWPERTRRSIFYPASLLSQLGWPNEIDRLTAGRARFNDLIGLARRRVSISTFTLEDDAIVPRSAFLEDVETLGLELHAVNVESSLVFVQEALREPVDDGGMLLEAVAPALTREQEGWLALRMSRSPSSDPAFHGHAGARDPSAYAVSHVERYLDCPFKYFSSYVLGLDEERNEEAGLSPRERGQFLHEVFQQFFVAWQAAGHRSITSETLQAALRIFESVVEARLARLSDADRALERNYLLGSAAAPGLADRAFAFEIEQGVGVIERLLEHTARRAIRADGPATARCGCSFAAKRIGSTSWTMGRCGSWTTNWVAHRSPLGRSSCRCTACAPRNNWRGGTGARGRCPAPATWRSARRTPSCRWERTPRRQPRRSKKGSSEWCRRLPVSSGGRSRRIPRSRFSARGAATPASAGRTTWAMSSRTPTVPRAAAIAVRHRAGAGSRACTAAGALAQAETVGQPEPASPRRRPSARRITTATRPRGASRSTRGTTSSSRRRRERARRRCWSRATSTC